MHTHTKNTDGSIVVADARLVRYTLFSAAATILVVGGCGGGVERVPVSGRVLIDGEPLAHGIVRVTPEGVRVSSGRLDAEGRFTLKTYKPGDGVALGTHPVLVNAGEQVTMSSVKWHAPPKYSNTATSDLTIEVDGPRDDVVINLTWGGKKPFVQRFGAEPTGQE